MFLHTKWIIDGVTTLDEAIAGLEAFKKELEALKRKGYVLRDPVSDGHLDLTRPRKKKNPSE